MHLTETGNERLTSSPIWEYRSAAATDWACYGRDLAGPQSRTVSVRITSLVARQAKKES
jgi:hypothetical protein